jgi:hypothetical protein
MTFLAHPNKHHIGMIFEKIKNILIQLSVMRKCFLSEVSSKEAGPLFIFCK